MNTVKISKNIFLCLLLTASWCNALDYASYRKTFKDDAEKQDENLLKKSVILKARFQQRIKDSDGKVKYSFRVEQTWSPPKNNQKQVQPHQIIQLACDQNTCADRLAHLEKNSDYFIVANKHVTKLRNWTTPVPHPTSNMDQDAVDFERYVHNKVACPDDDDCRIEVATHDPSEDQRLRYHVERNLWFWCPSNQGQHVEWWFRGSDNFSRVKESNGMWVNESRFSPRGGLKVDQDGWEFECRDVNTSKVLSKFTIKVEPENYDRDNTKCDGFICWNGGKCEVEDNKPKCACGRNYSGDRCQHDDNMRSVNGVKIVGTQWTMIILLFGCVTIIFIGMLYSFCRKSKHDEAAEDSTGTEMLDVSDVSSSIGSIQTSRCERTVTVTIVNDLLNNNNLKYDTKHYYLQS